MSERTSGAKRTYTHTRPTHKLNQNSSRSQQEAADSQERLLVQTNMPIYTHINTRRQTLHKAFATVGQAKNRNFTPVLGFKCKASLTFTVIPRPSRFYPQNVFGSRDNLRNYALGGHTGTQTFPWRRRTVPPGGCELCMTLFDRVRAKLCPPPLSHRKEAGGEEEGEEKKKLRH